MAMLAVEGAMERPTRVLPDMLVLLQPASAKTIASEVRINSQRLRSHVERTAHIASPAK
jgi:hypothetical protein